MKRYVELSFSLGLSITATGLVVAVGSFWAVGFLMDSLLRHETSTIQAFVLVVGFFAIVGGLGLFSFGMIVALGSLFAKLSDKLGSPRKDDDETGMHYFHGS